MIKHRMTVVALVVAVLFPAASFAQKAKYVFVLDPTKMEVKEGQKSQGLSDIHPYRVVGKEKGKLIVRDYEVKALVSEENTVPVDKAYTHCTNSLAATPGEPRALHFRAEVARRSGKPRVALKDLDQLIKADKATCQTYVSRGNAYQDLGEYKKALADFKKAVDLDPKSGIAQNSLAWLLATCPDAKIRDGGKAVEAAKKAIKQFKSPPAYVVDTLAAAHAESGDFKEAAKQQKKAKELMPSEFTAQVKEMNERIKLFEASKPYHETRKGKKEKE